jgi:predicted nucleic-acid-binding Zn-ribbon protein
MLCKHHYIPQPLHPLSKRSRLRISSLIASQMASLNCIVLISEIVSVYFRVQKNKFYLTFCINCSKIISILSIYTTSSCGLVQETRPQ